MTPETERDMYLKGERDLAVRSMQEWVEQTGAIGKTGSWYHELESLIELAFDAGCSAALEAKQVEVQMPRFNHAGKRKLEQLLGDGATITGYAFQKKDGRHGAIDCHGFVQWRADQADHIADAGKMVAAPVELPEPFTTLIRKKSWSTNCYEASPLSKHRDYGRLWADERVNVYTEHQLRALLAQHGIKIAD